MFTVTRLRRRLSVEADDVKSPSTQSTPTKKRGGRLAAKPQLELIDENGKKQPNTCWLATLYIYKYYFHYYVKPIIMQEMPCKVNYNIQQILCEIQQ